MENSWLREAMTDCKSVGVLAVRIMSSTYNNKYEMEEPWCKMNKEESLLEATKPSVRRKVVKR
jgi:hypothetical protein